MKGSERQKTDVEIKNKEYTWGKKNTQGEINVINHAMTKSKGLT